MIHALPLAYIVVVDVLPHTDISYSQLPPLPLCTTATADWPFDTLPAAARVHGAAQGQISDPTRARRKEEQLRSMLRCIVALGDGNKESNEHQPTPCTVIDFGGGTGHLAMPLALLRPHFTVIVVDLYKTALDLLHSKVEHCTVSAEAQEKAQQRHAPPQPDERLRQCTHIPNLYTFSGPLQDFEGTFDIGVALHLCGELTDVALRKCGRMRARAIVVAPCCVGKLDQSKKNPYIWQSTGSNARIVRYPQSRLLQSHITDENDWNALARAADYGLESRTTRNAARRAAKALLETDRRLWLQEEFAYHTALTRMEPWEATPKNDILLAWRDARGMIELGPNLECEADIRRTMEYLVCQPTSSSVSDNNGASNRNGPRDNGDWTEDEAQAIRETLQDFVASDETTLVFPVGMGARNRKLVHYIAGQMNLAHWGEGRRSYEKTVAVRKRPAVVVGNS